MQHIVAKDKALPIVDCERPIVPARAKQLIQQILKEGVYSFTQHAEKEMAKDDMSNMDCIAVLRGGAVEAAEFERGSFTYRVRTRRMTVVVTFRSQSHLVVITAWRIKQ